MKQRAIISRGQSLQILRNDLRAAALERYAERLKRATGQQRAEIIAKVDQEVEAEVRRRMTKREPRSLLH